jgi:predicted NBD/HSP70 family sugar kinase
MKHVRTKAAKDKAVILNVVRRFGPVSRVEVHELTYLRRSTICDLARELLDEKMLTEAGRSNNPLGRKQVLLRVNEESSFVLGIDFDAEVLSASVMDLHPTIVHQIRQPTFLGGGVEGLLQQLLECAQNVLQESGIPKTRLLGIGIGDPGLVDTEEGLSVISSTIGFWKQVPVRKFFQNKFGVPTILGNNTRCKTSAERLLSQTKMSDHMIYVEYSRGIGAGIITGGKILEGHRWSAGEFGHTRIAENGPPCRCGSFGCLEAIAGASAVENRIRTIIHAGGGSQALTMAGGDIDRITAWTVFEAASGGDKACAMIVEDVGRQLGLGLANLVNLFDPEIIVLDQRLELAGPALLDQIVRTVKLQALAHSCENLTLNFAKLGNDAGVLGAGLLVIESIFEIPVVRPPRFLIDSASASGPWSSRKAESESLQI